jgi:hypothetical protein
MAWGKLDIMAWHGMGKLKIILKACYVLRHASQLHVYVACKLLVTSFGIHSLHSTDVLMQEALYVAGCPKHVHVVLQQTASL